MDTLGHFACKSLQYLLGLFLFFYLFLYPNNSYGNMDMKGISVYSDQSQDYFVVAIHSDEGGSNDLYDGAFRRSIEIRIAIEKLHPRQFSRVWVNGSAINSSTSEFKKNAENLIEFGKCIKGRLVRGDIINITYDPDVGTSIVVNGIEIHTFSGDQSLFNLLLSVLIGEVPLSSKIKEELLGSPGSKAKTKAVKKYRALYDSLKPSPQRIARVQRIWLAEIAPLKKSLSATSPASFTKKAVEPPVKKVAQETAQQPIQQVVQQPVQKPVQKPVQQPVEKIVDNTASALDVASSASVEEDAMLDMDQDDQGLTLNNLFAERAFSKTVSDWLKESEVYPVVVANMPEKNGTKFTITLNKQGDLLGMRQFEASKYGALNKGAVKLIKGAVPYPTFPDEINGDIVEVDLYFVLHWRYLQ